MSVITVKRVIRRTRKKTSEGRRSLRELTRRFFAHEMKWQFVMETLLFAIIVAISAWPILVAADALAKFLQGSGT